MHHSPTRLDRFFDWFGRRWLGVINTLLAIYVALPIVAPILMNAGLTRIAAPIYKLYSLTCHQLAFRSFFIGGNQPVYPRAIANSFIKWDSFEMVVAHNDHFHTIPLDSVNLELLPEARTFLGAADLGYKTAICQRDLGIFAFLLVGGLLYGVLRPRIRIKPLPFWLFVLIGMGPIGLDGFSQLFGYIGEVNDLFQIAPFRESPPYLRTLTGAWFGLMLAWMVFPRLENLDDST